MCETEIDENGKEIEICDCFSEKNGPEIEASEDLCAEDDKVCTVEVDYNGDYIDVCVCPDATEDTSAECDEVDLICELVGPVGEEKEVCSCQPTQECSPEQLICTENGAGQESCICSIDAEE